MTSEASRANSNRLSREAKRRRTGVCESCGVTTRYNGSTVNGPSRFCGRCASARTGLARRGRGPVKQRLLALLAERGEMRFIEIRDYLGLTDGHTGVHLNDLVRYGLVERVRRGVYRLPAQ